MSSTCRFLVFLVKTSLTAQARFSPATLIQNVSNRQKGPIYGHFRIDIATALRSLFNGPVRPQITFDIFV
jgi:hypothetical protein